MREPTLTAREKFDWYDAMTFNPMLSHASVRVAHAIGAHLNQWSARTFISHDTLAKKLGVSTKTVERSIAELERFGYLGVTRSKGRGYANVYWAIIPDGARKRQDDSITKNPTVVSEKPDTAVQETRQECRPYPSILPNTITHKRDTPPSPPATSQPKAIQEPIIVREARLQEQGEQERIEAVLADRLTIGGDINGREVLLNADPQQLAILSVKCRQAELTPDDIAQVQGAYRALRARRMALEFMPEPTFSTFNPARLR